MQPHQASFSVEFSCVVSGEEARKFNEDLEALLGEPKPLTVTLVTRALERDIKQQIDGVMLAKIADETERNRLPIFRPLTFLDFCEFNAATVRKPVREVELENEAKALQNTVANLQHQLANANSEVARQRSNARAAQLETQAVLKNLEAKTREHDEYVEAVREAEAHNDDQFEQIRSALKIAKRAMNSMVTVECVNEDTDE